MNIQLRHGYFPRIVGKGDNAKRLSDLLLRMRKEVEADQSSDALHGLSKGNLPSASIDNLIIIDRDVDFASPMLTQLTYEGLIDEFVGIQNNHADIDTSIVGTAIPTGPQGASSTTSPSVAVPSGLKRKVQLDSADSLFVQLRDANFAIIGDMLNKVARRLETDYERRHQARTTAELREFVNKLPGYQQEHNSLKIHTNLAEDLMRQTRSDLFRKILEIQQSHAEGSDPSVYHEAIEELIARDVPLKSILRLLCLESCMSGGLRPKDLENFKRRILHAYGYQHVTTFRSLEKMELLQPRSSATAMLIPGSNATSGSKTNYSSLRKNLRLVVEEVSEKDPHDISYVYSGFAPLSVRLVQCVIQKPSIAALVKGGSTSVASAAPLVHAASTASPGWLGFEEIVKSARGSTFNVVQKGDDKAARARQTLSGGIETKTTYVFFLGGITFAEIAALRFISRQQESQRQIMICTTSIVSGDRMIDAGLEKGTFARKAPS
jgi:vacuolar protein sorting-associated protein 33A